MSDRARARRRGRELPETAASLARAVRGGSTLLEAFEEVSLHVAEPLRGEIAEIVRVVRRGRGLDDALRSWADESRSAEVDLVVTACRFGQREGGDLAAALDGAAVSLLDRIELADEARALTSQARASAWTLVALPILGAVGFSMLDPSVAATLFTTAPGLLCLVLGLGLDALGAAVLTRLVHGAVS